jgi:hypothetical protein
LAGVEKVAVFSEKSQSTCENGQRDNLIEKRVKSMLRKTTYNYRMINDGWVSIDPADEAILEGVYKKNIREGEERLMLAVLESAVEDFQKYVLARHTRGKKLFQQAEEWFLDTDSEEPFSFRSICETLGLHPDHIRKGLMVWKEARIKVSSDGQHAGHPKLAKSRVEPSTVRLSKTA